MKVWCMKPFLAYIKGNENTNKKMEMLQMLSKIVSIKQFKF